jgi:hypothetical protein
MYRTWGGQAQVSYSVVGWSRDRMTLRVICTVHKKMKNTNFLVEPQTKGRRFSDLRLKTGSSSLMIYASKSWCFIDLGLKIKRAYIDRLHHKTDGGMTAWDTSRSDGLLRREATMTRIFQPDFKTVRGTTMGGARGIIVEVASIWRRTYRYDRLHQTLLT